MKNRIKQVLDERGMTQKQLAEGIGMSEVGLSKAINGSATPATIAKIANHLQINESELVVVEQIHRAKYGSDKTPLKFGELEIGCYVLDNGMRVLSGRGIQKALGSPSTSGAWLTKFVNSGPLSSMFHTGENSIQERINNPLKFLRNNAGGSQSTTNGYEATLLIDLCSTIIDANRTGVYNDENIVKCADVIIRAVAKVGIIALIDEATGYAQAKEKAKDELQRFLSAFINEEASKWVKTFPDKFFEDLYKMLGWSWTASSKRPGYIGKIINDIVYDRIGPGLREELQRRNPKNENGNRTNRHHQFLTEIGKPRLISHIEALHALAVVSDYKWEQFMRYVDKSYPKSYVIPSLFEDIDLD